MVDCLLLAAGKGSRLQTLTEKIPKSLVRVNGKPIIEYIINILDNLQIDNIYIISGYKEGVLKNYFKFNIDRKVTFIHQKQQTGTADAIQLAKGMISNDFIVLAADTIFLKEDLEKLINTPNSILYTKKWDKLDECGTLVFNKDRIVFIAEKYVHPVSNLINCSAYHFDENIFEYIPRTQVDWRKNERIITNSINLMIRDGIEFKGNHIDNLLEVNYPQDIEKVEDELTKRGIK